MNNPLGWYSRFLYEQLLKKHNFGFDGIFYCSESKAPEDKLTGCQKYSAEIMIDDKPEVALYLADNGIKVFLFDTRYNQNVTHNNILRVYNWNDIYEKIKDIERT